jgi:hypothetical protein
MPASAGGVYETMMLETSRPDTTTADLLRD